MKVVLQIESMVFMMNVKKINKNNKVKEDIVLNYGDYLQIFLIYFQLLL
jgi:hypothetical protein